MPSNLKDNRPTRGSVGEFPRSEIVRDPKLSFVSACFTANAVTHGDHNPHATFSEDKALFTDEFHHE